jgi:hypothetical protein
MSDFMNPPPPPAPPPPPPQGQPPQFPQQYPPQYPQQFPQHGVYQPQVGAYPPGVVQHYGAPGRTSGLAIASMVLGILWLYWIGSILAVIFGHIAISQAGKDPTVRGKGMAIAGLVLGYIGVGFLVLAIVVAASSSSS